MGCMASRRWPVTASSRCSSPAPKRRARDARDKACRSPTLRMPSRTRASDKSASSRKARPSGSGPTFTASAPLTTIGASLLARARAPAVAAAPATAPRAAKPACPSRAKASCISPASPPSRWAQPVISSSRPSGGSTAASGVKRRAQSAKRCSMRASPAGSAGRRLSVGTIAWASARAWPGRKPSLCRGGVHRHDYPLRSLAGPDGERFVEAQIRLGAVDPVGGKIRQMQCQEAAGFEAHTATRAAAVHRICPACQVTDPGPTRLAATQAQQFQLPARITQAVAGARGIQGRDPPAAGSGTRRRGFGMAGRSSSPMPPPASAASCRRRLAVRSSAAAAGVRLPIGCQQGAGDRGAPQRLLHGPERIGPSIGADQDQIRRQQAESSKTWRPGGQPIRAAGDPDDGPAAAGQDYGGKSSTAAGFRRQDLMQGRPGKAVAGQTEPIAYRDRRRAMREPSTTFQPRYIGPAMRPAGPAGRGPAGFRRIAPWRALPLPQGPRLPPQQTRSGEGSRRTTWGDSGSARGTNQELNDYTQHRGRRASATPFRPAPLAPEAGFGSNPPPLRDTGTVHGNGHRCRFRHDQQRRRRPAARWQRRHGPLRRRPGGDGCLPLRALLLGARSVALSAMPPGRWPSMPISRIRWPAG